MERLCTPLKPALAGNFPLRRAAGYTRPVTERLLMVCIALCFLFSLASLAGWIAHQYVVETADYFAFPPEFWSAVFFTLFIAFGLEGFLRWRRAGVA